jgi:hypothetical protein
MKELGSIVDKGRTNPSIDVEAFPNTPSQGFCSSSPLAGSSGDVWAVSFGYGVSNYGDTSDAYRVRCVR